MSHQKFLRNFLQSREKIYLKIHMYISTLHIPTTFYLLNMLLFIFHVHFFGVFFFFHFGQVVFGGNSIKISVLYSHTHTTQRQHNTCMKGTLYSGKTTKMVTGLSDTSNSSQLNWRSFHSSPLNSFYLAINGSYNKQTY